MNTKAKHGTTTMYRNGCRCDDCKAAKAKEKADYTARKKCGNFVPKKRTKRVQLCMPIVLCMARDFGFTRIEMGDTFGCDASTISKRLNKIGYKPGKCSNNISGIKKRKQQCFNAFVERIEQEYNGRFEVIEHDHLRSKFRCNVCGTEFSRSKQAGKVICRECIRREREEKKAKEKEKRQQELLKRQQVCIHCGKEFHAIRKQKYCSHNCAQRHAYALNHPKIIKTCRTCGNEFEACSSKNVYCSGYCRRNSDENKAKLKNYKTGSIPDRLRRYGRAGEYRDCIPLDEVIERDNGICYLCGCKTDKNDCWHDENGYFVCGERYPTRDHVIPISKGGTHTWDNVRLACHKCNSRKNNRQLEEYALDLR